MDLETRPRVISALWQYVKLHDLLDAQDATVVLLDARLKALFAPAVGLYKLANPVDP
jgi:chromatin remodeling complex protein RSC6